MLTGLGSINMTTVARTLAQPAEQLRQADIQHVRDLARGIHGDVDPAAFQ